MGGRAFIERLKIRGESGFCGIHNLHKMLDIKMLIY